MAAQHCIGSVLWPFVRLGTSLAADVLVISTLRENLPGPSGSAFLQAREEFLPYHPRLIDVIRSWSCVWAKLARCSFGCVSLISIRLGITVASADIRLPHSLLRLPNCSPGLLQDGLCLQP
jgi:hypothetical protein